MQSIILLAGYGGRLKRDDLPHKALLPFGQDTLLSRHLDCLQKAGVECVYLVLGHNKEAVKDYVLSLRLDLPVHFIDNDVYRTTGNTLSLVLGLRQCIGDVLILDGDVFYPPAVLLEYIDKGSASSFALVPSDIDNEECAKVLLRASGEIDAFITKRALTAQERADFQFGGEAIGFFKLSAAEAKCFVRLYESREREFEKVLWEIPFTEFAREADLLPWFIPNEDCFEIDTQEDYDAALASFEENPDTYL